MTTQSTIYKRQFSFLDADRNKVTAEVEMTTRNGYPEFTASGEFMGSLGQCFDHVKPDNDSQKEFISLCGTWHLNGMSAGTERQAKIVKGLGYDDACRTLITYNKQGEPMDKDHADIMLKIWDELKEREIEGSEVILMAANMTDKERSDFFYFNIIARYGGNEMILFAGGKDESLESKAIRYFFATETLLFDLHPETDELYRYGTGWIRKTLPDDFEETLYALIDEIEELEEEKRGEHLTEMDDAELVDFIEEKTFFSGRDAELCAALVKMFDLTGADLEDIEISGTAVTVQGDDYLAGDDDEMDEAWNDELENYIDECILPEVNEKYRMYFDNEAWKRDAKHDGRGHSLNRYDGGEESATINGTEYFAYRQ